MAEGDEYTIEQLIKKLPADSQKEFSRIYYGNPKSEKIILKTKSIATANKYKVDLQAYKFTAAKEETRAPRVIRVGLIQHGIALPTDERPIEKQRNAIHEKVKELLEIAGQEEVNVLCLQEAWPMPFALCTREKVPWLEFAESAEYGPSTIFLQEMAKKYKMVIVSPIIERDEKIEDVFWNTAVVISDSGRVIGKHRKNHLPNIGSFDETMWFAPGNTGHPVFETRYGKIAVNICYGRHHPQNWLMFGLNGAEVVFNPAATISEFGEAFWGIEARNAAIANSYFTCSINRVGSEYFHTSTMRTVMRSYYGSSYITAPDGVRTPGLSRKREGLLIGEMDLNLCRQVKDKWAFNMTRRLDLYAQQVNNAVENRS